MQSKRLLRPFLICFVFFTFPRLLSAAIIFVNPSAAGSNNGTSWANAYTSLSSALVAATSGDEIWVKQGVYKPVTAVDFNGSGGTEAREVTFQISNGVALYGGFAGTELTRDERDWNTNLTILSGDIDNNDLNADANFIAENTSDIVGNNAYHVVYTLNVNATTRVDGFIITAGNATSAAVITDANQDGGGWYNQLSGVTNASSPTIVNSTFQGNYAASEGGAIFCTNAAAGGAVLSLIQNCKFNYNKSNVAGGAINLGSFNVGNYQPHITNCAFNMNEAYRRGGAIYFVGDHAKIDTTSFTNNKVTAVSPDGSTLPGSGGAVNMVGSNTIFNNCFFTGNNTTGNPTGPFEGGGGGAVYMSTNEVQTTSLGISQPTFISCGFYANIANGNTAAWGGAAVHLNDGGKLRPHYINCVFSGNQAQNDGGAIANFTRVISVASGFIPELTPAVTNCTFDGNHAGARGGAVYNDGYVYLGSEVLNSGIENSILWNNTAATDGPEVFFTGNNTVAYSLIQGSGGSGGGWNSTVGTDGGNNLDVSPSFFNEGDPDGVDNIPATADDGLSLVVSSPAVDAGNNAAVGLAGITTDYISAARILGSKVDMGAYERAGNSIPHIPIYWLKDWRPYVPGCLKCPWAFLLGTKVFENYIWDGPAQLIDNGTTAIVTGHIIDPKNIHSGFTVYLKLINKSNWISWSLQGRTYTAITPQAILFASSAHKRWTFWDLSGDSYLSGTGDLSGQLKLAHLPVTHKTGFQLGEGANGYDTDPGASGYFSYKGTLVQKGKKIIVSGTGSMNVDAAICKKACVPLPVGGLLKEPGSLPEAEYEKEGFSVFPVPAHDQLTIVPNTISAGKYTVKLYNDLGQLKKQEYMFNGKGNFILPVSGLRPGIYLLQLLSSTGETFSKKLVIE